MTVRIFDALSKTWALIAALVIMLLAGYSFSALQDAVGGPLLDMAFGAEAARARLAELSPEQATAHLWGTLVNDTVYPLAYGALFLGLIWRLAGQTLRPWFVAPVLAAVACDLLENAVQALALMGIDAGLAAKTLLTPAKFGCFLLSVVLVLASVLIGAVRKLRASAGRGQAAP